MKHASRRHLWIALAGVGLGVAALFGMIGGCYELPPRIDDEYRRRPLAEGWPPPSVYGADPLHPANRWYQRAFAARGADSLPLRAPADLPFSLLGSLRAVDRAELLALLAAVSEAGPPADADPLSRLLLHSDLLYMAARWKALAGEDELARACEEVAGRLHVPCVAAEGSLTPPPLRNGRWQEVGERQAGGRSDRGGDFRGRRILFEFAGEPAKGGVPVLEAAVPERASLVLLRMAGESFAAARWCELASECWVLERSDGEIIPRLFRFDRAAYLEGREPWTEAAADSEVAIVDPTRADNVLTGSLTTLCGYCHTEEEPFRSRREGVILR